MMRLGLGFKACEGDERLKDIARSGDSQPDSDHVLRQIQG